MKFFKKIFSEKGKSDETDIVPIENNETQELILRHSNGRSDEEVSDNSETIMEIQKLTILDKLSILLEEILQKDFELKKFKKNTALGMTLDSFLNERNLNRKCGGEIINKVQEAFSEELRKFTADARNGFQLNQAIKLLRKKFEEQGTAFVDSFCVKSADELAALFDAKPEFFTDKVERALLKKHVNLTYSDSEEVLKIIVKNAQSFETIEAIWNICVDSSDINNIKVLRPEFFSYVLEHSKCIPVEHQKTMLGLYCNRITDELTIDNYITQYRQYVLKNPHVWQKFKTEYFEKCIHFYVYFMSNSYVGRLSSDGLDENQKILLSNIVEYLAFAEIEHEDLAKRILQNIFPQIIDQMKRGLSRESTIASCKIFQLLLESLEQFSVEFHEMALRTICSFIEELITAYDVAMKKLNGENINIAQLVSKNFYEINDKKNGKFEIVQIHIDEGVDKRILAFIEMGKILQVAFRSILYSIQENIEDPRKKQKLGDIFLQSNLYTSEQYWKHPVLRVLNEEYIVNTGDKLKSTLDEFDL